MPCVRPEPIPVAAGLPARGAGGAPLLFAVCSAIWGSTWLAITFQLGSVAPAVSVCYRFGLAAGLLAGGCMLTARPLGFPLRIHAWLAAQGVLMFGLNYVATYKAEEHVASGLVAVLFSTIVFMSMLGTRVVFGIRTTRRALTGAVLGVGGVTLLFLPEILRASAGQATLEGVAWGLSAAFLCMCGNLVSMKMQRDRLPIVATTAWGMAYGALSAAMTAWTTGASWSFDPRFGYVASLLYLAVPGTIVAFLSYLNLLERVGAATASYVAVATPVLAMLLSTAMEGYRWTAPAMLGVALAIVGNMIVLRAPRPHVKSVHRRHRARRDPSSL